MTERTTPGRAARQAEPHRRANRKVRDCVGYAVGRPVGLSDAVHAKPSDTCASTAAGIQRG